MARARASRSKATRPRKKGAARLPSTTPPFRPAIGSLDIPDPRWYLSHVEAIARTTCEKHHITLEAALEVYDRERRDLVDTRDLLMYTHRLESRPIILIEHSTKSERKALELRFAAALARYSREARSLLHKQPADGGRIFRLGAIIRGLHESLLYPTTASSQRKRARKQQHLQKMEKLQPMVDFVIGRQEVRNWVNVGRKMVLYREARDRRTEVKAWINKHNNLGIAGSEVPSIDWFIELIRPLVPYSKQGGRPPPEEN